jgi:hypothetical protein
MKGSTPEVPIKVGSFDLAATLDNREELRRPGATSGTTSEFTTTTGVARFFLVQNTKTGKVTKLPRTIPNVHKI